MMTPDEAEEREAWKTIKEDPGRGGNERTPLPTRAGTAIEMPPGDRDRDGNVADGDGDGVCVCGGGWQASGSWLWQKWWRMIMIKKWEQTWVR